ncbi:MAG: signal peptidase I [Micavibrio sp.]|nr:MAG: signal peptidase I [Micavibrio sp.]
MMEEQIQETEEKPHEPPMTAKEELSEFFRTALIAVVLALLIRTFMYEPFNIPSGSMKPTLEIGDYLFVHKPAYGYSKHSFPFSFAPIEGRIWSKEPQRGDVIVFKLPSNPRIDYIKRVVAFSGETVQVREGRLYINGQIVPREPVGLQRIDDQYRGEVTPMEYIETLPGGVLHRIYEENDDRPYDNTELFTVPKGHYFVMGDNRDNSQDSRAGDRGVGYVPYENIVGKADFIFFSTNGHARLMEVWKWPWSIRYDRFFVQLDPVRDDIDAEEPQSE